jgi:hypothetical protein
MASSTLYGICKQQGQCTCGLCPHIEPVKTNSQPRFKLHYLLPTSNFQVACGLFIDDEFRIVDRTDDVTCQQCVLAIERNKSEVAAKRAALAESKA